MAPEEDPHQVPLCELDGKHLVVEEKMDGANAGISFGGDGELLIQSRGHFLTGGWRERHFDLLKSWAWRERCGLFKIFGT